MKLKTRIFTTKTCQVLVPEHILNSENLGSDISFLNVISDNPSRLKDGIQVTYDALNEADKKHFSPEFSEMVKELLSNYKQVDEFLFHC